MQPLNNLAERAVEPIPWGGETSVLILYQDALTRQWATDCWDGVQRIIGEEGLHFSTRLLENLGRPPVFQDSVWKAAEADVLLLCLRGDGPLPLELRSWVNAWLPRRAERPGLLATILGATTMAGSPWSLRAEEYLKAVARVAHLDFLLQQRELCSDLNQVRKPVSQAAADDVERIFRYGHDPRASWA